MTLRLRLVHVSLAGLFLLLALVILPTGTPEDLFTTAILIEHLGFSGYIVLVAGLLLLMVGLGLFGSYILILKKTRGGVLKRLK